MYTGIAGALTATLAFASAVSAAPQQTFDYIVVGGGTAGNAVATRLSLGLPDADILVIEAGPDYKDAEVINIPGYRGRGIGSRFDWNWTTIPQPGAQGRTIIQPRGKVLGGSSALNFLTHNRASAPEFDTWESLGNPGWNAKNLQAAMMKAENFSTGFNTQYYGTRGIGLTGPVKVAVNRIVPVQQESWIPTLNNLGIPSNKESLAGNPIGVMWHPSALNPDRYVRSTSANSFLPVAGPNLKVWTEKRVAKINLKSVGGKQRATGITLEGGLVVNARREVILSAGALHTPGLLELSGIGRADVLAAAGIKQIIDSPGVGENLQDHQRAQVSLQLKDNYTSFDILTFNQTFAAEQLALWRANKVSMWDYTNTAFAFTNWRQAIGQSNEATVNSLAQQSSDGSVAHRTNLKWLKDPKVPQTELIFQDGYIGEKGYPAPGSPLYGKSFFTIVNCLMHPYSRGSVHIKSKNLNDVPIINPNLMENKHDVEAMVNIIKFARKIANTEPMRSLWVAEYEPGAAVNTDEALREYVRNTTMPIFHPSGTAALLPKKDGGVVDARLKVYGTHNLRVIDASIMPVLISAHLATAVYGIAEHGAQLVLEDAN